MNKSDKEALLINRLIEQKRVDLDEAMDLLNVSQSTVRRIFMKLEESGQAIRIHGGISLAGVCEYSFNQLCLSNTRQKAAIGARACQEINSGECIYIDCGTTTLAFCIKLAECIKNKHINNLQIFTNSLANLEVLSPVAAMTLIGGKYRHYRRDFCGYIAEIALEKLYFDKCFLGCDGYNKNNKGEFLATDFDTARLCKIVLNNTKERYILADSDKFLQSSLVSFCSAVDLHYLITDIDVTDDVISVILKNGVKVIKVNS